MNSLPVVSFKEVHKEIEKEHLLLNKEHDIKDFESKATFLKSIGLTNSITTKLYSDIVESSNIIDEYRFKYKDKYKLILGSQLERVCEKYNLYLRPLPFFLGDIPEKNIKDLQQFKVYFEDLLVVEKQYNINSNHHDFHNYIKRYISEEHYKQELAQYIAVKFSNTAGIELDGVNKVDRFVYDLDQFIIPIEHFEKLDLLQYLFIAAPKDMFAQEAFKPSELRIVNKHEQLAKNVVDLDPIILFATKHGYLIITAWGDESNDELVANQYLN